MMPNRHPTPSRWATRAFSLALSTGLLLAMTAAPALPLPCAGVPGDDRCEQWVMNYDHLNADFGFDITVPLAVAAGRNPNGDRVYLSGPVGDRNGDWATIAVDQATGVKVWEARYNGRDGSTDDPLGIALSPDGSRLYVTGRQNWGFLTSDIATIAYNAATGQQLWVASYDGAPPGQTNLEAGLAVAVARNGSRVFVTGASVGAAGSSTYDFITIAYNAKDGSRVWLAGYDGPGHAIDGAVALAVDPGGLRVYVTGHSAGDSDTFDYATVAYDAHPPTSHGKVLWVARYTGPENGEDLPLDIAVTPNGSRVVVTGYSNSDQGASTDYATVAYRAKNGRQLWAQRYRGPVGGYSQPHGLAMSPSGDRVFVTGESPGSNQQNDYDYATVAYDTATGTQAWAARYGQPLPYTGATIREGANDVQVSPGGDRVYVTGASQDEGQKWSAATVAYDSGTGSQLWVARYAPTPGPLDSGVGMALSVGRGSGTVFVAALSEYWIVDQNNPPGTTHYLFSVLAYAK